MIDFINTLSESKLLPSKTHLHKYKAVDLSNLAYLYLCALYVVFNEDQRWAKDYAYKVIQHSDFKQWRNNTNDLYIILYALTEPVELRDPKDSDRFKRTLPVGEAVLRRWLRDMSQGTMHDATNRALFTRLDYNFRVQDSSFRAIRRLVMDWPELTADQQDIAVKRLVEFISHRAPTAEILAPLRRVKPDEPEDVKEENLWKSFAESATSGATGAASVATAVGGLGCGFDPNGHKGIYQDAKTEKKSKKKPLVLKR